MREREPVQRAFALPKPTVIDRLVGVFSPQAMVGRLQARVGLARYGALQMRFGQGGYDAADRGRRAMANSRNQEVSADRALLPDLDRLRGMSSDLVRNMPLATGALDNIATKVVGSGLQLQARPDRKFLGLSDDEVRTWEEQVERCWKLLAEQIDYQREFTLPVLEYLCLHSMLEQGDLFILLTSEKYPGDQFDLKLQLIEAGRVTNPQLGPDTPQIAGGIEYDTQGRKVAAHIADRYPWDGGRNAYDSVKWTRVPFFGEQSGRRNLIQLMAPTRLNQSRGVPLLAPVIEALKQLGEYTDAELMASVVNSCFAIISKTEGGGAMPTLGEKKTSTGEFKREELTFNPGTVVEGLLPNEEISSFSPGRPNAAFEGFFTAITQNIAVALGLSHEVLVRHFTASYSAARAALLEVWETMRRRRTWLSAQLHQAVYVEMISQGIESGIITAAGWDVPLYRAAWSRARWIGPAPGQLNPKDEVQAATLMVDAGFSTAETQTAELGGGDYDSNQEQRAREVALARSMGIAPTTAITAVGESAPGGTKAPSSDNQGAGSDTAETADAA